MKNRLFTTLGVAALTAAMAGAQAVPTPADPSGGGRQRAMRRNGNPAARLNLTDAQKQQARTIFQQTRNQAKPVADQLKQARQDLRAAAAANAPDAEISRLSARVGELTGQVATVRSKGMAQFYALLTPEQRAQAEANREARVRNVRRAMMRMHRHRGGVPAQPPAAPPQQ